MSRKSARLRRFRIINAYDFITKASQILGARSLAVVDWTPGERGRGYRPRGYNVFAPGFKTDPGAHWMHNGSKFYMADERHKGPALEQALMFAREWDARMSPNVDLSGEYVRLLGYDAILRDSWVPREALDAIESWLRHEEEVSSS